MRRRLTLEEFRRTWRHRQAAVFDVRPAVPLPMPVGGTAFGPYWLAPHVPLMVFRPGYTFTFLDATQSLLTGDDGPRQFEALRSFMRASGETEFVRVYHPWKYGGHLDAVETDVGAFSVDVPWDDTRVEGQFERFTYGAGIGDSYLFGVRPTWGLYHAEDHEVAIAGTWGPEATGAFRAALGVEGDGFEAIAHKMSPHGSRPMDAPAALAEFVRLYVRSR